MKRISFITLASVLVSLAAAALPAAEPAGGPSRIEFRQNDEKGAMRVMIDGREALVYRYGADLDLAHFFPVRSPTGQSMTVEHPKVYPHHRSFWFADTVQLAGRRKASFYGALYSREKRDDPQSPFRDHIRHVAMTTGPATKDSAEVAMKLLWEMDRDVPVLDEARNVRVAALGDGEYFLDITFTLTASYGDVKFVSDAVHYAWPYIRMNDRFSVNGGGTITNSEGGKNQKGTHNKRARWVDYSNTVDGETAGLAVFSRADNEPPRWLTRDYGCFGPRRCDAESGKPFTLAKGRSLSQRVGVLVHRGDVKTGRVAERYEEYVR